LIRIAAVGDLHFGADSATYLREPFQHLPEVADVLLIAGDLTLTGYVEEAAVIANALAQVAIPVVAVLGNHDYHQDQQEKITHLLREARVVVLDGDAITLEVAGTRLGIAGVKGFGGGFAGACGTEFGEPEMKAFIRHTKELAQRLEEALRVEAEIRIALLHYSPVEATLLGERLEIYPFLGSFLLGEAVDRAGADLVLHGHAHAGMERGATPGGIRVRNVSYPVIGNAYNIYGIDRSADGHDVRIVEGAIER
jgi:Icc-related predicted phosphoesterase